MLMSTWLAYTTGFSMMLNVGQLTNNGVEVEVSYDAFRSRDAFRHTFMPTFAYNANKIDKLFNGQQSWDRPSYTT